MTVKEARNTVGTDTTVVVIDSRNVRCYFENLDHSALDKEVKSIKVGKVAKNGCLIFVVD